MTAPARAGTPDQLRAITAKGMDLCVVAGAGTGKTHVLTSRIVERVLRGGVDLRSVLAITFTEKAAAEMKERLAAALEAAGRRTARTDVEAAAISTVHAFCARLLREHAVAAGVDPAFAVLDEEESDRLLRGALDRLVDLWRDSAPVDFATLAALGGDDPAETLLAIYREAQASGRAVGEFVRTVDGLPNAAAGVAAVRAAVSGVASHEGKGTAASQTQVAAALAAARGLPPDDAPPETLERAVAALAASFKLQCGEPQKGALRALREACEAALPVLAERSLLPLREVAARAVEQLDTLYDEEKGRGQRLDFADLERSAVALLAGRDDVRAAVRRRWPEALVDEFQDTNPVQARLVALLRTEGRLFVVGDPKQSIYGFRGADVAVFEEHLAAVAAQGKDGVVTLRHSFRSRPELLGAVNRLFEGGVGGVGATGAEGRPGADLRLVAGRAWAPLAAADAPCVEVALFSSKALATARGEEAAWIAAEIARLEGSLRVGAPTKEEPLRTRAAAWGDFAVLLRATTHIKVVEQALVAREIPYAVVKGRGFFHAREVVDVAHLLACVDDPRDDLALATVLRGPACGLSDDALFVLTSSRTRRDDRRTVAPTAAPVEAAAPTDRRDALIDVVDAWVAGAFEVLGLADADAAALRRFAALLAELRARRAADGVAALVDRVFLRTRLDVLALGRPNGRQRAANLRKVRARARDADDAGLSLREFVEDLRDLREREVREAEAAVAGGDGGAVQLLTVHASKGLEYPVVFVPDAARSERAESARVVSDVRCGVGLRGRAGAPSKVKPWAWARIAERGDAADEAESERLLYVAVTRAADRLVVTGAMSAGRTDDARRVWWPRLVKAFGLSPGGGDGADAAAGDAAGAERDRAATGDAPADRDVGPGADEAGATRAIVRYRMQTAPAGALPDAVPRNLLGRRARELAAGVVPAMPLRPEAREEAARLLAEAERTAPPPDGTPYATNVSALTAFDRCPQEYRLRHVALVPEDDGPRLFGARTAFDADESPPSDADRPGDTDEREVAPSTRALGRAAHAALERLVPAFGAAGAVERAVDEALRAEAGGASPDPAEVARLTSWIDAFRRSALAREVAAAPREDVRREQAFLLRAGRTVVRGQIDLMWRAGGAWTLLDWKTGRADPPRPEHALQLRLYALGVRAATRTFPARLLLWSLSGGAATEVPCGPGEIRATEGLLADFSARSAARDWRPRERPPCEDCRVRAACRFSTVR